MNNTIKRKTNVALFVTCLADLFRPSVGFAAIKLLEDAGCKVEVPIYQTCCGQPAWNSGDRKDICETAVDVIKNFEAYEYVVVPSCSCASMIKNHYPEVFKEDPIWEERALKFASKSYELGSFLTDVLGLKNLNIKFDADVTYHASCTSLYEPDNPSGSRMLLESVDGLKLTEMTNQATCCGLGSKFKGEISEISSSAAINMGEDIEQNNVYVLTSGDLGCLLNIAGKVKRLHHKIEVRHVAEILAGMTDITPIGHKFIPEKKGSK